MDLTIEAEPFDSADARRLVDELDAHLGSRYLPRQMFGRNFKPEQIEGGRGTFLIARRGGRAVGCGALRLLTEREAEVKRMYVEPGTRGSGVGRLILERLEVEARSLGVARLVLETGIHQLEAIGLYRGCGFAEVECWGEYRTAETSLCMAKDIGPV